METELDTTNQDSTAETEGIETKEAQTGRAMVVDNVGSMAIEAARRSQLSNGDRSPYFA
jgi:hypothetical protein